MPDYKTKYTNRQGKVIPALADIEYKGKKGEASSDTIVYLSPQVPGANFHKIVLSGPDSKYYQFEDADGTFYRNDEYEDYYVPRAREAVKNAQPRSFGEKVKHGIKNFFSFEQGGEINKYLFGGDIPRRENYGLMNDGNMNYADSPNLSLPSPKPAVFDPNAGKEEAFNQQWEARRKELADQVMNGSARRINMRREQRRFQRNFDQTWDDQELIRKGLFDIANGPAGLLKATPVETPVTTATYFDSPSPTAAPSNEARGQKEINKFDEQIAAQNAAFAKKRRLDDYYLAEARKYGFDSLEAVKKWQSQQKGLVADGYFGKKSLERWKAMKSPQQPTTGMFVDPFAPQVSTKADAPVSVVATNGGYAADDPRAGVKTFKPVYDDFVDANGNIVRGYRDESDKIVLSQKTGGVMNKYQQGGAVPQQDIQQQVKQLVQAAVIQKNPEAVKQIKQIIEAAQQGDEQAIQIATLIQKEMESVQKAQKGAKLNYIKSLKGDCPDGEEVVYFKKGGMLCKACEKKKMKAEQGKKLNAIEEFKKGRKCKK